jgi:hypothetical protein
LTDPSPADRRPPSATRIAIAWVVSAVLVIGLIVSTLILRGGPG